MTFLHHSIALFKVLVTTNLTKGHYLVLDLAFIPIDHSHAKILSCPFKAMILHILPHKLLPFKFLFFLLLM